MEFRKATWEYWGENAYWGLLAMFWYRSRLFRSLSWLTLRQSRILLWVVFVLLMLGGVLLTMDHARNGYSTLITVLGVFEVYTFLSYFRSFPAVYAVTLLAAVILGSITFLRESSVQRRRRCPEPLFPIIHCRAVVTLVCAVTIVPLIFGFLLGDSLIPNPEPAVSRKQTPYGGIAEHIDRLGDLRPEVWNTLSSAEKAGVLQVAANVEREYLGLPHELNVIVTLSKEHTLAYYDDSSHVISLNIEMFDDSTAEDSLDSVCHESYHAYQARLCDLYDTLDPAYTGLLPFVDVPRYQWENDHYVNGDDDMLAYYVQTSEVRAREYARNRVQEYYYLINKIYDNDTA